jgi:hypothetical protein
MVRRERVVMPVVRHATPETEPAPAEEQVDIDATQGIPAVADDTPEPPAPGSWDPMPVTLPTYVSKPVATRSVRTIDLDSTGVWTSGHSEADSALVRDSAPVERETGTDEKRALGS